MFAQQSTVKSKISHRALSLDFLLINLFYSESFFTQIQTKIILKNDMPKSDSLREQGLFRNSELGVQYFGQAVTVDKIHVNKKQLVRFLKNNKR